MKSSSKRSAIDTELDPVRNLDAEQCALGCAMLADKGLEAVTRVLKPEMFYSPANRKIYEAILRVKGEGKPVDLMTVSDELGLKNELMGCGGNLYMIEVAESVPSVANARGYAEIVKEHWVRREMLARMETAMAEIRENDGYRAVWKFIRDCGKGLADTTVCDYSLEDVMAEIDAHDDETSHKFGVRTGIDWIDSLTEIGGLAIGEPTIIIGPTGGGKSALMTQIMLSMIMGGKSIACATYEMTPEWLIRRCLKHLCGWANRPYKPEYLDAYNDAKDTLRDKFLADLHFFDPSAEDSITSTVEALARWHEGNDASKHVDCLFVDYAQLIGSERQFRSPGEELTHVTRVLGKTIKRTRSACVILSQQNNEGETSNTRELMKIASLILRIGENQDEIHIVKSRHGLSKLSIPVAFDNYHLRFEPVGRL